MSISDGWSNKDPEVRGPFSVFMADGSNFLDIPTYEEAVSKADEQPGSKVSGRGGGVAYVSQPRSEIPDRKRTGGPRERRSSDLI